ncbi:MAG: UDP-N-acetylmuramate dehydrogenase [Bacteroidetes bacterium]|nr:UDP-N-acetylmuramate dehydrogenase [Bacteroidota bacterium]
MKIAENTSLAAFNTFGIPVTAQYFAEAGTVEELKEIIANPDFADVPKLILGGGSNLLFTVNYNGLVIKNNLLGIELQKSDEKHYYVKAGAGENWHQFVLHCIKHNYAGVENLSLIPGNIGASPMQNIGAYGVEIKDVFESLEALELSTGEIHTFYNSDCKFGYRESVFKNELKGKYIISAVTFRLNKKPKFNTSYGAIEQELEKMGVQELSIKAVSDAVINIRRSKLPDPAEIGNAGSFFKNPVVDCLFYENLKKNFPEIPAYPQPDGSIKLAAGWLIEKSGLKGYRKGDAGIHEKQALVIVNYGHASGKELYDLSTFVLKTVFEMFGVQLEREVNIVI